MEEGAAKGSATFNQVLSMIISPSAVIKIQVYRGSPFKSHNEMVAYYTVPAANVADEGEDLELSMIEEGEGGGGEEGNGTPGRRERTGPRLTVQWVWGVGLNSPTKMSQM